MRAATRAAAALTLLAAGLGAQAGLDYATRTPRPPLNRPLASLPMTLGDWQGADEPVDPLIARESQATEFLNRIYVDPRRPGRRVWLWMNYSATGLNMRHSPEICLPSGGWTKAESMTRVISLPAVDPGGDATTVTLLGYTQGELVQRIGFWYYIFGEGRLERTVRTLPITSRSSHGRTTRGSGLTVEIFFPGDSDVDGEVLAGFAAELLEALGPILPDERASYHVP